MTVLPGWDERRTVLAEVIHRAEAGAIFLDVDGVLAPIMPRPDQTFVSEELRDLVRRLTRAYRLVAVVSGRAARDAQRLVGLTEILVVGNHGMESLSGAEHAWLVPDEALDRVRAARDQLAGDAALAEYEVRLEDKVGSVALHTRGVPEEAQAWEVALTAARLAADEQSLVMLPGRQVVDLRPPGINKGTAVRHLMEHNELEAGLYVGDDRTDVDAFRTLRALGDERAVASAAVAVVSDESPDELFDWADLAISFEQVGPLLAFLADEATASTH